MSFLSIFSKESIDDLCKKGDVHIEFSVRGPDIEVINIKVNPADPYGPPIRSKRREPNILFSSGTTIKSYEQLVSDFDNFKVWCDMAKHQDPLEKKRLV